MKIDAGYVDRKVQVSGAFGDIKSKSRANIHGLISKPKVTFVAVKDTTEFVLLAADGIWDALEEPTVLPTARKVLRESRSSEAAGAGSIAICRDDFPKQLRNINRQHDGSRTDNAAHCHGGLVEPTPNKPLGKPLHVLGASCRTTTAIHEASAKQQLKKKDGPPV